MKKRQLSNYHPFITVSMATENQINSLLIFIPGDDFFFKKRKIHNI